MQFEDFSSEVKEVVEVWRNKSLPRLLEKLELVADYNEYFREHHYSFRCDTGTQLWYRPLYVRDYFYNLMVLFSISLDESNELLLFAGKKNYWIPEKYLEEAKQHDLRRFLA